MKGDAGRWLCHLYYIGKLDDPVLKKCVEGCLLRSGLVAKRWRELMLGEFVKVNQSKRDRLMGGKSLDALSGTSLRNSIDGSDKEASAWEVLLWEQVEELLTGLLK